MADSIWHLWLKKDQTTVDITLHRIYNKDWATWIEENPASATEKKSFTTCVFSRLGISPRAAGRGRGRGIGRGIGRGRRTADSDEEEELPNRVRYYIHQMENK